MYFFSPLCDVFLFVKGELRWWESRNSITVNSNTPPSHSTLWHWCGTKVSRVTSQTFTTGHKGIALLGSRNTGVLCCFVRRWSTHRENKPHLAHEEKFWDSNKCWQKKKKNCFQYFWNLSNFWALVRAAGTKCAEHYPCGIHFLFQRTALKNWLQTVYQAINPPLSHHLYEGSKKSIRRGLTASFILIRSVL